MARRRKKRRRRNFGSILTVWTVLIVAGAIITSITVFLKVAKFEVVGTSKYSPAEIIEASGIKTGENMFSVNKFKVSSNILKKFPYIGQIKINRRFPDTFIFTVTERTRRDILKRMTESGLSRPTGICSKALNARV